GCVETILSGPALERFYESVSGEKASLKEITQYYLSQQNDAAKQTIERLTWFFGKAVSVVTNLLDPDIFVVGGGVGNIDVLYTSGIQSLQHHIFNNRLDVPVYKPALGDSAGVFGAAALVS
ncbi:MAG: ROK family protein, partial [Chitinophagaceae bacterium]|nr:ROK family protein [Chitinophagaceae bacterium]